MPTTLITGASSGIGRELALALAAPGETFYLLARDEERLRKVADEIAKKGGETYTHSCDLTHFSAVQEWYDNLRKSGVEIDTFYHSAGCGVFGKFLKISQEDIEWVYQTNLLTTAQWISMIYPEMAAKKRGKIVIISSLSAYSGLVYASAYSATKSALLILGKSIQPEAERDGIDFQIVCPGFIRTNLFDNCRYRSCLKDEILNGIKRLGFPMMNPRKAARITIRAVAKKKKVIIYPSYAKLISFVSFKCETIINLFHLRFIKLLNKESPPSRKPPPFSGFDNKVCVITGAGSGIGEQLVRQLIEENAIVYGLDISSKRLSTLETSLPEKAQFHAVTADISQYPDLQAAAENIHSEAGKVDYLFNNAGITLLGLTTNLHFDQWKKVLDVNYLGTQYCIHAFYPLMAKRERGHIVNIASLAGHCGYASAQAYAASKAAVLGLTRVLEIEARCHGVRISRVCPSYVRTNIFADADTSNWSQQTIESTFLSPPMNAQAAATEILQGIRRDKKLIIFPLGGRFLYHLASWCPWTIGKIQKIILSKYLSANSSNKSTL